MKVDAKVTIGGVGVSLIISALFFKTGDYLGFGVFLAIALVILVIGLLLH